MQQLWGREGTVSMGSRLLHANPPPASASPPALALLLGQTSFKR